MAFTRARVAVFVDGCFWHGCPEHGTRSSAQQRLVAHEDRPRTGPGTSTPTRVLEASGWRVLRVWEHEDPTSAAAAVLALVRPAGP